MANDAQKTSELGITTTLSATDRVVVLTNPDGSAATQTIAASYLANSTLNLMRSANTSASGVVIVDGTTIVISNTGIISANSTTTIQKVAVPSTSSSAGSTGQITWDSNFIYVCVATNQWKRASLGSW